MELVPFIMASNIISGHFETGLSRTNQIGCAILVLGNRPAETTAYTQSQQPAKQLVLNERIFQQLSLILSLSRISGDLVSFYFIN